MKAILLGGIAALQTYFIVYLIIDLVKHREQLSITAHKREYVWGAVIGGITSGLDTIGIGSFAPHTFLMNVTRTNDDKKLPGTLNVSHCISVLIEAFIFISVVTVAPLTIFSLIISSIVGSWIGSRTISTFSERKVQLIMGIALLFTSVLMILRQQGFLDILGKGNEAMSLTGGKLIIGIVGNFVFGALMTVGVGLFAPCMAMIYLLGISPIVAYPIMMGSCAGLMPVACVEFIKADHYDRVHSFSAILGGIVGVLVAARFVTGLDVSSLTWIIILIIIYTGIVYIYKGTHRSSPREAESHI